MTEDLFKTPAEASTARPPLADRMRPRTFAEFIGQSDLVGPDRPLRRSLAGAKPAEASAKAGPPPSMILWGPPGTGKTTLARIIAAEAGLRFSEFSAVMSGVKEIKGIVEQARFDLQRTGKPTLLFVDEIHRFNKSQQDAFLPHVENGTIVLIGATTENPSFEVNAALLSRSRVYTLQALTDAEMRGIVERAAADPERGLGALKPALDDDALGLLVNLANGDARTALNLLELAVASAPYDAPDAPRRVTRKLVEESAQRRTLLYDKGGEEHYNLISALHKSLRGSDAQAAVYWLARMLEAGEEPLYLARRMVRFASEDIGNADPQALTIALAAKDAVDFLGMPEANTALAQCATYLATAPKSNAVYTAYNDAKRDVEQTRNDPVPLHLRNAPTKLMKDLDYGKGYQYAHDMPEGIETQEHLPDNLKGRVYYDPKEIGFEREIRKRLEYWEKRRRELLGPTGGSSTPRHHDTKDTKTT